MDGDGPWQVEGTDRMGVRSTVRPAAAMISAIIRSEDVPVKVSLIRSMMTIGTAYRKSRRRR